MTQIFQNLCKRLQWKIFFLPSIQPIPTTTPSAHTEENIFNGFFCVKLLPEFLYANISKFKYIF